MAEILNDQEMLRYNRQIILNDFDFDGQEALKQSAILIIGAGGLGCAASQYLASSGAGKITLVDFDRVELSNLQRQVLHTDNDIGKFKVDSAGESLRSLNPHLELITIANKLSENELFDQVKKHDLVLDATDNIETRNQLNRLCFQMKIPLISGAAIRTEGQISVFTYRENEPCYQCLSSLFSQDNLTCVETGILAPVVGIIGAMQAMEAIKIIANFGESPIGKLLILDGKNLQFREIKLAKNDQCSLCG
jgi:adenylyltransferase/sulfurtransferase